MKRKGRNKRKLFCFGDSIVPGWDAESTQRECSKIRRQADQVAIQQGLEEYEDSMKLDPEEESLMDELDDQVNDWYETQYWRDVEEDFYRFMEEPLFPDPFVPDDQIIDCGPDSYEGSF